MDRTVSENPLPEDAPIVDTFKSIGIGSGGVKDFTDKQKAAFVAADKDAFNLRSGRAGTPGKGSLFAGIDIIGDYLTELNVTSPTGIRELDATCNARIGERLIMAISTKLKKVRIW